MTTRLEKVIQQLPPQKLEQLVDYAEFLAARTPTAPTVAPSNSLKLDWVGAAADLYPEHQSGVEAMHAVNEMRIEKLKRAAGE